MLEFLSKFWQPITLLLTVIGLGITISKLYANSYALNKIQTNELAHLAKTLEEHKKSDKEFREKLEKDELGFKKEIKEELHSITLGLSRLERKIIRREAICDERHRKDKS